MYLMYVDESGDPGLTKSPTKFFILSALLISDLDWSDRFEKIKEYRRSIKIKYGIKLHDELKGRYFYRGNGAWWGLSYNENERHKEYLNLMNFQANLKNLKIINICIKKDIIIKRQMKNVDPREMAWKFLLQRFQTFLKKKEPEKTMGMVLPDSGHEQFIQSLIRKMRVFSPVPSMYNPSEVLQHKLENIIEDPFSKDSKHSYFHQFVDMNAYALLRKLLPRQPFNEKLFDTIDPILLKEASRTDPQGIVFWPD